MPENRLDIVIGAKLDGLRRGLRTAEQEAKKASRGISDALESAGDGAEAIESALNSVDDAFSSSAEEGQQALDKLADSSTEAGRDLRKAFEGSGKSLNEVEQEVEQLVRNLGNLAKSKADVAKIKAEFDDLEGSVKDAKGEIDGISFQNALNGVEAFASKIDEVSAIFKEVASESRSLERSVKLVFDSEAEAAKFLKTAQGIKDTFGDLVTEEGLGEAAAQVKKFSLDGEKDLERITKAALGAGRDVGDAAETMGEALADLDSGTFDIGAFEQLRTELGIGSEQLREYGAQVKLNGEILGDNRAQQEAAQKALRRYIDESDRYTDIATRNKDAQAKLADESAKFARSVGEQIDTFKEFVSEALLPVLETLNDLPDGFKKTIAGATLLAPVVAGTAIAGANAAAVYTTLSGKALPSFAAITGKATAATAGLTTSLTALGARVATVATGIGGVIAVVGAAAVALKLISNSAKGYVEALEQVDKAQTDLINTEARFLRQNKDILKIRRQSIDELRAEAAEIEELGQRRVLATKAVEDAVLQLREAERAGQDTSEFKQREADARAFREEIDQSIKAEAEREQKAAKATQERFKVAQAAYLEFKTKYDNGVFDSEKKALESLESIANNLGQSDPEVEKNLKDLRGRILATEIDALNKRVQAEEITAEKSQSILSGLLSRYQANTDQRKDAEEKLSGSIQGILEKRLATAKQYADRELALQRSALQQRKQFLENDNQELSSLERRLAKGEDVVSQIKKQTAAQNEKLKAIIEEEAALERAAIAREKASAIEADPGNADTIARQAAERTRQLNAQVAADKQKLDREVSEASIKLDEQRAKIQKSQAKKKADLESKASALAVQRFDAEKSAQEEVFALKSQALDEEEARGRDVSQQRIDLTKEEVAFAKKASAERLKLIAEEIKARTDAANAGATPAQQAVNNEKAKLDLLQAQKTERQSLKSLTDQELQDSKSKLETLKEELKVLQDQNAEKKKSQGFDTSFGGLSGVEDINSFGGGFGQKRGQATTEDGRTEADIQRQITQAEVKVISGQEAAGIGFQQDSVGPEITRLLSELVSISKANSNPVSESGANSGNIFERGARRLPGR